MLDYNSIVKERNIIVPCCNKESFCIHIEASQLVDGTYELVPTNENESASAQVNSLELIQDPNQSLEEAKASSAQEGKPWCI